MALATGGNPAAQERALASAAAQFLVAQTSGGCSQSVPGLGSNAGSSPPSEQADPSKPASMRTTGHTEGSRGGRAVPPSGPVGSQRLAASAPGRGRGLQQGAMCVRGHGPTLTPAVSSATPLIHAVSPRVFVQTPILGFQNRFAASFLKCTRTQPARSCRATSCWT